MDAVDSFALGLSVVLFGATLWLACVMARHLDEVRDESVD